jgi:hypothetical protein
MAEDAAAAVVLVPLALRTYTALYLLRLGPFAAQP